MPKTGLETCGAENALDAGTCPEDEAPKIGVFEPVNVAVADCEVDGVDVVLFKLLLPNAKFCETDPKVDATKDDVTVVFVESFVLAVLNITDENAGILLTLLWVFDDGLSAPKENPGAIELDVVLNIFVVAKSDADVTDSIC